MKKTRKSSGGTSFHSDTFRASVAQLRSILGEPIHDNNYGRDKVNFEWEMETESGDVFTVYDWKEYRSIDEDEDIVWHIGGHSANVTSKALEEIVDALKKLY